MSEQNTEPVWVTQDAYDRLSTELDHLRGPVRAEITQRIAEARDEGDLKENGGYHAARDEQGKVEARVRQLEDLLRRAKVGETPPDDGVVEAGMVVTIAFEGDDSDTETFLLGSRELLSLDDSVELDIYSPNSPLGEAIVGRSAGETTSYETPTGATITIKILKARPL